MITDTVTPRVSNEEQFYEHFKEINWWARHPNAWKWMSAVYGLVLVALSFYAKTGVISTEIVVGSAVGFIPFLFLLAVIKHVVHDRPLRNFKKTWGLDAANWSSNIGGILKIYD